MIFVRLKVAQWNITSLLICLNSIQTLSTSWMPPRTNGYAVGLLTGNKVFKPQSILTFKFKVKMIELHCVSHLCCFNVEHRNFDDSPIMCSFGTLLI